MKPSPKAKCKCAEHGTDESWHGTSSGYVYHRCRCGRCSASRAERARQWREANRERRAEYNRQWHEANRERRAEYNRQWHEANRERRAEYNRQRRALVKELGMTEGNRAQNEARELCRERATVSGKWTTVEDHYLIATYRDLTIEEQALALRRTYGSVRSRLHCLRREGVIERKYAPPMKFAS